MRERWWLDGRGLVVYDADGAFRVAHGSLAEQMGLTKPFAMDEPITAEWLRKLGYKCKPSIFMPRWASRLTLAITDVRVERLQEISEADAVAEGLVRSLDYGKAGQCRSAREAYARLWDAINGRHHPWDSSPWCWAISFRRVTT